MDLLQFLGCLSSFVVPFVFLSRDVQKFSNYHFKAYETKNKSLTVAKAEHECFQNGGFLAVMNQNYLGKRAEMELKFQMKKDRGYLIKLFQQNKTSKWDNGKIIQKNKGFNKRGKIPSRKKQCPTLIRTTKYYVRSLPCSSSIGYICLLPRKNRLVILQQKKEDKNKTKIEVELPFDTNGIQPWMIVLFNVFMIIFCFACCIYNWCFTCFEDDEGPRGMRHFLKMRKHLGKPRPRSSYNYYK